MARVVVSAVAAADLSQILTDLAREAGHRVAEKYNDRFDRLYLRLAEFPELGPGRPKLGPGLRIGIVPPYLVAYRYRAGDSVVGIVRVVHGHRRITRKLIRAT